MIARKVRDLGVFAEVRPSDTPASELRGRKGIIISGGPASVYEPGSPRIDPAILHQDAAVLGICYGLQLMAHELGGSVRKGTRGEYGLALLDLIGEHPLLRGFDGDRQVWMSHRDTVETIPPGFELFGTTGTCPVAVMAHRDKRLAGVQFHPEVVHTPKGLELLANFVFGYCGCERDWDPTDRIAPLEEEIRGAAGGRNVFFFVSGGVDSTVAYTLCLRALGPERVYGLYVDTGLMREAESDFVRGLFALLGATHFHVEDASADFLNALSGLTEPEQKRKAIGEEFVRVQERILRGGRFLDGQWILGQGTIYPDTIESGGSAKADVIKTHHNRVAGIQKLLEEGRILEPLSSFYKDEVREIGAELAIPDEFLHRHPFPGPGLAIRCLCSETDEPARHGPEGWILPVHSVGVQGDSRSYRPVLVIDSLDHSRATELINASAEVNRVVGLARSHCKMEDLRVRASTITEERLARLRRADAAVRRLCHETGYDREIWQFPVVLIPAGTAGRPDSIVLRPVNSLDGMTAQSVVMPKPLLNRICDELLAMSGISSVFYDLTHKPPGTIEWE